MNSFPKQIMSTSTFNDEVDQIVRHLVAIRPSVRSQLTTSNVEFDDMDVSRTVGWFTTKYPVNLDLSADTNIGHNLKTIAICTHGLTFAETWPRGAQAAAVISLCGSINTALHGIVGYWPHNSVANKACPVWDVTELLGLDRWRRMP